MTGLDLLCSGNDQQKLKLAFELVRLMFLDSQTPRATLHRNTHTDPDAQAHARTHTPTHSHSLTHTCKHCNLFSITSHRITGGHEPRRAHQQGRNAEFLGLLPTHCHGCQRGCERGAVFCSSVDGGAVFMLCNLVLLSVSGLSFFVCFVFARESDQRAMFFQRPALYLARCSCPPNARTPSSPTKSRMPRTSSSRVRHTRCRLKLIYLPAAFKHVPSLEHKAWCSFLLFSCGHGRRRRGQL